MQLQRVLFGKMAKKYVFCSVRTQCGQNKRQNVKFICEYNAKTQLRIKTDAHTQELNNLKIKRNNLSLFQAAIFQLFFGPFFNAAQNKILLWALIFSFSLLLLFVRFSILFLEVRFCSLVFVFDCMCSRVHMQRRKLHFSGDHTYELRLTYAPSNRCCYYYILFLVRIFELPSCIFCAGLSLLLLKLLIGFYFAISYLVSDQNWSFSHAFCFFVCFESRRKLLLSCCQEKKTRN